jgi:hypothetical protein
MNEKVRSLRFAHKKEREGRGKDGIEVGWKKDGIEVGEGKGQVGGGKRKYVNNWKLRQRNELSKGHQNSTIYLFR